MFINISPPSPKLGKKPGVRGSNPKSVGSLRSPWMCRSLCDDAGVPSSVMARLLPAINPDEPPVNPSCVRQPRLAPVKLVSPALLVVPNAASAEA